MIFKFILLALSGLINSNSIVPSSANEEGLDQFKEKISKEISKMTFKLLIGIVLISAIIFSIVQLGIAYQMWLKRFENSFTIEVISFSLFTFLFAWVLYFLFYYDPNNKYDKQVAKQLVLEHNSYPLENPQSVVVSFVQAVKEGFKAH